MSFITEVLSAAAQENTPQSRQRTSELALAVVKENWNDQFPGRVKVEYVLGEEGKYLSDWIRVLQPYAAKEYGAYVLPEIGSEVLVAFVSGDRDCAVVVGCLYNGENKLPPDVADKDNNVKFFKTRGGHEVRLSEEKGKEKIEIKTPGELSVTLDDENQKAELRDKSGNNQILLDAKNKQVSVKGEKKLELECGGLKVLLDGSTKKLEISADQISVNGKQSLELTSQSLKAEGSMTELKAKGTMKIEASGIAQIKGAMLKLN